MEDEIILALRKPEWTAKELALVAKYGVAVVQCAEAPTAACGINLPAQAGVGSLPSKRNNLKMEGCSLFLHYISLLSPLLLIQPEPSGAIMYRGEFISGLQLTTYLNTVVFGWTEVQNMHPRIQFSPL